MVNKKILTVCGVLLAMGLTACGAKTNPSGGSGGGDKSGTQSHTHVWDEGRVTKPATCDEPGEKTFTCTGEGTCPNNNTKTEAIPALGHQFGDATKVDKSGADDVDYYTALCSVDSALKLSFPTEVGGVYQGTERKSGTPTGYTKLKGNGSISWKINLAGSKIYKGKMYHMATMDAFSSNSEKNYGYYTTSGSSTRPEGNFNFYVNGKLTDKSAYMNISFGDLTKGGENDPELDKITSSPGPYGPVALCPIADDVYLTPGENVFKYERTGSYNMVMREMVFIGKEFEQWGPAQDVAADTAAGTVAFKKYESNIDDSIKIEIASMACTFDVGGNKTGNGAPEEGYMKLGTNNDQASWKFNYDSVANGIIYQVGYMDSYSSNLNKTYAWVSSSSSQTTEEGNFEVTMNTVKVDKSPYMSLTFEQLTKNGEEVFESSKNYSKVGMMPIGEVELKSGVNTITYKRLGSYNFAISKLIIIVENYDHAHEPSAEYAKDADYHWKTCGHQGCDVILNKVPHKWIADDSETDTASSCTVRGVKHFKCSVCGQKKSENQPLAAHEWIADPDHADEPSATCAPGKHYEKCKNCTATRVVDLPSDVPHTWGDAQAKVGDATPHECSVCHAVAYQLDLATPEKLKKDIEWSITGLPAGSYGIELYACASSSTLTQTYDSRYQFKVDSGSYIGASDDSATYASYGLGTGEALANCQWSKTINKIDIAQGAAKFTIHWTNKGYSAFIAAVRLVKNAA